MKHIHSKQNAEAGSVVTYILLAVFLSGLLIMSVTEGPKRNAQTQQLDELGIMLNGDLMITESAVNDCILMYSTPIDRDGDGDKDTTDNPNVPFPVIYDSTSGYAMTGPLAKAICLGTPSTPMTPPTAATNQQKLIGGQNGRFLQVLGDTVHYTTTLTTDTTEGVYLRVTRNSANALWAEGITRLNAQMSACKAAVVTAAGPCVNGCLYFWFKRLPTSVIGGEAGCP